jgi:hypothetical protein
MTTRACLLVAAALAACSHSSSAASGPAASASATGSAAPATSAAGANASPVADPSPPNGALQVFAKGFAKVKAWNDALNSHDVAALGPLYFKHVCYYGRVVALDEVLKQKKSALGAASSFQQQIVGDVKFVQSQGGFLVGRFTKRSGLAARLRDTQARIVLRRDADSDELRILEEADESGPVGDSTPDACAQLAWSAVTQERCEDAASRVVNAMPRVKKIVDELTAASTEGHAMGGMGPQDNGDGTFSASIGVQTPDRFEGRIDYTVQRATGHLTVSIDDTDAPVPESAQRELASACKP